MLSWKSVGPFDLTPSSTLHQISYSNANSTKISGNLAGDGKLKMAETSVQQCASENFKNRILEIERDWLQNYCLSHRALFVGSFAYWLQPIFAFRCVSETKKIWRRWYDQKLLFGCLLLAAVVITAAIEYRIAYHLRYWLFYDRNYDRSKIIFNSWRDFFNIRMKNFSLSFIYQQSQTCTGYSWNFFNEKFCFDCIRQQWVKILSLFVT